MNKQRVYVVISHVGEYSDQSFNVIGVFESKEMAETFIQEETFVSPELLVKEEAEYLKQVWDPFVKREEERIARIQANLKETKEKRAELLRQWKSGEITKDMWSKLTSAYDKQCKRLDREERYQNPYNDEPWCDRMTWCRSRHGIQIPENLSIEEHVLQGL